VINKKEKEKTIIAKIRYTM